MGPNEIGSVAVLPPNGRQAINRIIAYTVGGRICDARPQKVSQLFEKYIYKCMHLETINRLVSKWSFVIISGSQYFINMLQL